MVYAAYKQRKRVHGQANDVLPFNTPVHVRGKVYGTGGKNDLDNRWQEGVYVGPSSDLREGHVVRYSNGHYVTSAHLRPYLVDADEGIHLDPVEMDLAVPKRTVRTKAKLSALVKGRGKPLSEVELEAEKLACELHGAEDWSVQAVQRLFEVLRGVKASGTRSSLTPGSTEWYAGTYVHGGVAGIRSQAVKKGGDAPFEGGEAYDLFT